MPAILRMTKVRTLPPLFRTLDGRTTPLLKDDDRAYRTPAYREWRAAVVGRAGGQCEANDDDGFRCTRAWPEHRMFADHIHELRDGGSVLDLNNGQCLCASHHRRKTIEAQVRRIKC